MTFPEPDYWTYPNGDVVEVYSYHHIREYEQHREMNNMTREQFKPANSITTPCRVYPTSPVTEA